MRSLLKPFLGAALAGLLAVPAFADTLDDVCKKIDAANAKVKSYTVKMKMVQDMDMGGMKSKTNADGATEYKRGDAKKYYMHSEMKMTMETSGGGQDMKMAQNTLAVIDGEFMWSLSEYTEGQMKGQKMAAKMKAQPDQSNMAAIREVMDFKLLPDEKVDGQDCFVLEGKPKASGGETIDSKSVMYYRKDVGLPVKIVSFMNGKQVGVTTLSDYKLDASIPEDHFKFKVPAGVEVQDMTNLNMGGAAAPAEGDKKADEPKAEPKKEEPKKEEPKEEPKKKEEKKPLLPKPKLP